MSMECLCVCGEKVKNGQISCPKCGGGKFIYVSPADVPTETKGKPTSTKGKPTSDPMLVMGTLLVMGLLVFLFVIFSLLRARISMSFQTVFGIMGLFMLICVGIIILFILWLELFDKTWRELGKENKRIEKYKRERRKKEREEEREEEKEMEKYRREMRKENKRIEKYKRERRKKEREEEKEMEKYRREMRKENRDENRENSRTLS